MSADCIHKMRVLRVFARVSLVSGDANVRGRVRYRAAIAPILINRRAPGPGAAGSSPLHYYPTHTQTHPRRPTYNVKG